MSGGRLASSIISIRAPFRTRIMMELGILTASGAASAVSHGSASKRYGFPPFYKSPMKDFGYDVSDYCSVDPLFRSMACFDALVTEAHAHGLKREKETVRVSPGPSATLVHSFNSNIGRATLATTS